MSTNEKFLSIMKKVLPIFILSFYILPYFILGKEGNIIIHDNLDSNIIWFKILAESGSLFSNSKEIIPNMMNGLPRSCFGSEFNVILWLYIIFDPYWAYAINLTFMHSVAFFGMYLLLKTHILQKNENKLINIGVALCFSILPFWPSGGLSVAGLPLALYSFLNIRNNNFSKKDLIIIILLPFYSSITLAFIFFLFALGVIWLYDSFKSKKINWKFFSTILLMSVIYLFVEYRLVYSIFFDSGFISHRNEFISPNYSIMDSLLLAKDNFIYGHYQAASLHHLFILYSVIISFILILYRNFRIFYQKGSWNIKYLLKSEIYLMSIVILIGVISIWYGFWLSWIWESLKSIFSILNEFNLSRFHFLHPILWYISFAFALDIIYDNINLKTIKKDIPIKSIKSILISLIILSQLFLLFFNNIAINKDLGDYIGNKVSFNEFYSPELFQEISTDIGVPKNDYRIVSIGLYPSIAQFNGFHTLDGYMANYPLEYKHDFRYIIEPELNKNEELKNYFDNWGSRCYIFVDELGRNYMYTKDLDKTIQNLNLNFTALKNLGGKFIFSAVEILNKNDIDINLLKIYENESSIWRIFLYEII